MRRINFTKMHGMGNDYVYINCFEENLDNIDIPSLAIKMSERRFSVGSDGLILICPSEICDAKMRMFNADGSEGKMCGNGIRCVAKYCYDFGIAKKDQISIETLSGVKKITINADGGKMQNAVVDMGVCELMPERIPVQSESNKVALTVLSRHFLLTCVSMGNPHAVTFLDSLDFDIEPFGRQIENNAIFPNKVNVEFARVIDSRTIQMRVWERGSGETYACGTGACAVAVSAVLNGYSEYETEITIKLLGGDLVITVKKDLSVLMQGGATVVYNGIYEYEE